MNAMTGAVTPGLCGPHPDHDACSVVHEALRTGRVQGYFSEALLAVDVLENKVAMVGGARITTATDSSTATISIGTQWPGAVVSPISLELIRVAQNLGMKALIGPRYLGNSLSVHGMGDDFYENSGLPANLAIRHQKTNEVESALRQRKIGRARVEELGKEYSKQYGASGEFWMQGLERGVARAGDDAERRKARKAIHKAINEWADGDAIAAHIGCGNDLFCTLDRGGRSGQNSVLHPSNRDWLQSAYGVEFVTPSELADRLGR